MCSDSEEIFYLIATVRQLTRKETFLLYGNDILLLYSSKSGYFWLSVLC